MIKHLYLSTEQFVTKGSVDKFISSTLILQSKRDLIEPYLEKISKNIYEHVAFLRGEEF